MTVCVEHLNSHVADHLMKGNRGNDLGRVAGLIRQVDSSRLKLLFDIYHARIMHGEILRRLEECKDIIGHIHTAGNPRRGELDNLQEIHYPTVGVMLQQMGYAGFVGHEFIPTRDAEAGICEAILVCEGF